VAKDGLSFRAKHYRNRKKEDRVQLSGLQADFVKLIKGDKDSLDDVKTKVTEALKNAAPADEE